MKILLYPHAGSRNHGCEALVRGTCKVLKTKKEDTYLFSIGVEQDQNAGLDEVCNLKNQNQEIQRMSVGYLKAVVQNKILKDQEAYDRLSFKELFDLADKNTIALSIGGDNYCYADNKRYTMLHDLFLERGAKTVLWGCSVEPELIKRPEIVNDLKRYSLITARETISYNALRSVNPNTVLVADPAFVLDKKEIPIPKVMESQEFVGINLSPMIVDNESNNGITVKNYEMLIEHILEKTDFSIMLVPHVVWEFSDDRIPLKNLYEKYKTSGRIVLLEDMSCEQLKGYIAKCRFFIGARTHSTIAAYSSCVPTLVVGYSVKAIGIARDLFGIEDNYVISVQSLEKEEDVLNHFRWLCDHEKEIKTKLEIKMETYKIKSYSAGDALKKLW